MDSDHSESEFCYPDEVEKFSDKENIGSQQKENQQKAQFMMASVQKYIFTQRPENTVEKTEYDLPVWKRFFLEVGEARKIEEIPAEELNILICQFLMEIKKKDGGSYEPATLQSFQRSLQQYLKDKNSKLNILKNREFLKSREVLLSKKKQLVFEEARVNRPYAAKELSNAEEDLSFRTGEFGAENPEALHARDKSKKINWGDIVLQIDNETGEEFLIWKSERGSKTRRGNGDTRASNPTAQATNNERCPVFYYKEFKGHRPEEMNSAFYLAINYRRRPGSNIWYMRAPLGKNEIGKLMKTAAQSAGLQGNFTNHTVRKTCISRLMDAEVPVNYVVQLSGHRNLKSLDSYLAASADHRRKMSLILSRSGQESTQTSTVSVHENTTLPANLPKDVSKSGVFSGAYIGKIEGCTFTFNIALVP